VEQLMRVVGATASATLMAAAMIPAGSTAHAAVDPALNGTYTATSDGQWAKKNEVLTAEDVVVSTWTVSSTCENPVNCRGRVSSDQGWSADLRMTGGSLWIVTHDVENWERCPDGTAFTGHQHYKFYRVDDNNLKGWDETLGPSGACGVNKWLFVKMPFTLVKTG
jgi:hypothetical protein